MRMLTRMEARERATVGAAVARIEAGGNRASRRVGDQGSGQRMQQAIQGSCECNGIRYIIGCQAERELGEVARDSVSPSVIPVLLIK